MDKQVLEMLTKMQTAIEGIQSDVNTMKSDIDLMKSDISTMKSDIKDINVRLDTLDEQLNVGFKQAGERFDTIEKTVNKIANHEVGFMKSKIHKLEEDVYSLNKNHH